MSRFLSDLLGKARAALPTTQAGRAAHAQHLIDEGAAGEIARLDANLDQLRAADPDAKRLFDGISFAAAARDPEYLGEHLQRQIAAYAVLKHQENRPHLYQAIHDGLDARL
jgi:hypothetical protein